MTLVNATLTNVSSNNGKTVKVKYNPTEYSVTTNMNFAEIAVPGLSVPLLQFVRGDAQTLSVELYLDKSDSGESLKQDLDDLRGFVTLDSELHAPPVCEFKWGDTNKFVGVVTGFTEKFLMFDESGNVLRARVTLSIKSYRPAELQYKEKNPQSPDRTKTRVVEEGERLDLIAAEVYGDESLWPVLARANDIERPRLIKAGDLLTIPPL